MAASYQLLASNKAVGMLSRCPRGCFHLQLGRTSVALTEQEYIELVAMVNESAANYELLRTGDLRLSTEDEAGGPDGTGVEG